MTEKAMKPKSTEHLIVRVLHNPTNGFEDPDLVRWVNSLHSGMIEPFLHTSDKFPHNRPIWPTIRKHKGEDLYVCAECLYTNRLSDFIHHVNGEL